MALPKASELVAFRPEARKTIKSFDFAANSVKKNSEKYWNIVSLKTPLQVRIIQQVTSGGARWQKNKYAIQLQLLYEQIIQN